VSEVPVDPAAVERVAALVPTGGRRVVAVDGVDGAGKTTFAEALAERLRVDGRDAVRASIDGFHHPLEHRRAEGRTPEAVWSRHFDHAALRRELIEPWRAGPPATYRPAIHDVAYDVELDLPPRTPPEEGVLVVDGLFCQRPELDGCWDLVVFLDVPFAVSVSRLAARDGSVDDVDDPDQSRYIEAQRIYFDLCDPRGRADVVIDNS
jgi:uridine kinase